MSYPPPKGSFRDILGAGKVVPFTKKHTRAYIIANWCIASMPLGLCFLLAFGDSGITTIWGPVGILMAAGVFFFFWKLHKWALSVFRYRESLYRECLESQRAEAEEADTLRLNK